MQYRTASCTVACLALLGLTLGGCDAGETTDTPMPMPMCQPACTAGAHVSNAACVAGRCELTCSAGYGDCDKSAANGCEVDTAQTVAHCGGCGMACSAANSTASCQSGSCRYTCSAGFADCDQNMANGCEENTGTSLRHCGGCGMGCPGTACVGGQCQLATSCAALLQARGGIPSGPYMIDPDGAGAMAPIQVYCDMTSDGGGWTLVAMMSGTSTGFYYDSQLWTTANLMNATVVDPMADMDMKNAAFSALPVTAFRYCLDTLNATSCLVDTQSAASAQAMFTGAETVKAIARTEFMRIDPQQDTVHNMQPNCNRAGYNINLPTRCRFGIIMNNENDCASADSGVGFGCRRDAIPHNVSAGAISWNGEPGMRHPTKVWIFIK